MLIGLRPINEASISAAVAFNSGCLAGRALIDAELTPYAGDHRIDIAGPDVQLSPRQTVNLGMVLHELATNAAKYGALTQPGGAVSIEWTLSNGSDLMLQWR